MGIYSSKLICKQIQPLLDEWIFLLALRGVTLWVCELLAFAEVLRLSAKPIPIMPQENICDNFAAWNTAQLSSFQLQVRFLEEFYKLVFLGDIHRYGFSDASLLSFTLSLPCWNILSVLLRRDNIHQSTWSYLILEKSLS